MGTRKKRGTCKKRNTCNTCKTCNTRKTRNKRGTCKTCKIRNKKGGGPPLWTPKRKEVLRIRQTVKQLANNQHNRAARLQERLLVQPSKYKRLVTLRATELLTPPSIDINNALQYYRATYPLRFRILSELATEKLLFNKIKHNARLTNQLSNYVSQYATIAANYPILNNTQDLLRMGLRIAPLNQALSKWHEEEQQHVPPSFHTLQPIYEQSPKLLNISLIHLEITPDDVPHVFAWIRAGNDLVAEMQHQLGPHLSGSSINTKEDNISSTCKILYLVASGFASWMKEDANKAERTSGLFKPAEQNPCIESANLAAATYHNWKSYDHIIGRNPDMTIANGFLKRVRTAGCSSSLVKLLQLAKSGRN